MSDRGPGIGPDDRHATAPGNDGAYARGLLARALDPATQPGAIRDFLREELALVRRLLPPGSSVVDFGCGAGRHLVDLADGIRLGVGVDTQHGSIAEAVRARPPRHCHFFVGDATAVPIARTFDRAVCLTNTWGTVSDKRGVLREMRRLAPSDRARLLTVWAETSIPARRAWYANMGYRVIAETDAELRAEGGFTSEHFTEERLRGLLGPCELHRVGDVAYLAEC